MSEWSENAAMMLTLLEKDLYNMSRPDTYVIKDLVSVVRLLNERLAKLEKQRKRRKA